jgi:hypothetical protein
MRLGFPLLLYLAASLLHFAHNAEYLADYPNLPAWLTPSGIYLTWIAQAAFGFDGLLHYSRAPLDAHSFGMNFTISFEVAAAAILLSTVVYQLARRR